MAEEKEMSILMEQFKAMDKDNSGFIEKKELFQILQSICQDLGVPAPSEKDVEEAIKGIDLNKDGKISFEEYKKVMQSAIMDK